MSRDTDTAQQGDSKPTEGGVCLRCGKPYEPDDTVCYSCGAPIGETKTPTQPVRTVRVPRTDPAPETVELKAVKTKPAKPEKSAKATPSRYRTVVVTEETPAKSKSRRGLWLALGAVLLVIVLAGGGFYLVRGLTAGPPVASQSRYQDPQHRFTFQRPTLWNVVTTATGAQLSDSDGSSTIVIAAIQPQTVQTAKSYADAQATQLGLGLAPAQQIGGETWEQRAGQVTDQTDGAVHQIVLFVTVHDGLIYSITFTSPIASYTQINNLVYQPLLASFTFEN